AILRKHYKWVTLIICCLVYSVAYLCRRNYTGVASYLMTDWNIGKGEIGLIGSAFYFAYALSQSPWAVLTDKYGARRMIPVSVGLTGISLGLFAVATDYTQGLIFRIIMGLASGATYAPCAGLIAKWFKKKERGLAMLLFTGPGGGLGEAIAFLLVPVLALFLSEGVTIAGYGTWRAATLIMAVLTIAIAFLALIVVRNDPTALGLESVSEVEDKQVVGDLSYKEAIIGALRDPGYWAANLAWIGFIVSLRTVPGWLPIYAAAYYAQNLGYGKAEAVVAGGVIGTIYVIGRLIGNPLLGKLSDFLMTRFTIPRLMVVAVIHTITFIGLVIMTMPIPSVVILSVLAFIFGFSTNSYALVGTATAEIWSLKASNFTMAFQNTLGQLVGATVLSMSGFMAIKFAVKGAGVHSEYQGIWYLGMIFMVIAIFASLYGAKREKKVLQQKNSAQ
ncbi:MAG TPA: MFS transporter, partial [Negativicutes bacterium]|nr:MFS transporter [Negativicutes bacterium]